MTSLRETAQAALKELETLKERGVWGDWDGVTDALKAALVEDAMQKFTDVNQELQAALGCDHCNSPLYAAIKCRVCGRETPIIEPKIKRDNKPVAWIQPDHLQKARVAPFLCRVEPTQRCSDFVALYTAPPPPQRKPLSEEEIDSIWDSEKAFADIYAIVRAIERAHGIGGDE